MKAPRRENRISLPAFSSGTRDASYGASHPGWQKYRTEALEFKVFQEKNSTKAIQVIARREGAINRDFLKSFLDEVAGDQPYKKGSLKKEGGYLIEGGRKGSVEVDLYRNIAAGDVRGVVVVFGNEGAPPRTSP